MIQSILIGNMPFNIIQQLVSIEKKTIVKDFFFKSKKKYKKKKNIIEL